MKGGDKHKVLVEFAKRRLMEQGVRIIGYDAEVDENVQVDIVGVRGDEIVGVECYRQIQPKYLQRRLSSLRDKLNRIIVCVPDEVQAKKVSSLGFNVEIWVAGLEIGFTGIKVPRELVRKLNEIRHEGESLADVIERLLLLAKQNQRNES
jgi:hypothetical protein